MGHSRGRAVMGLEEELTSIFQKAGIEFKPEYMMHGFVWADGRVPKGTPAAETDEPSH